MCALSFEDSFKTPSDAESTSRRELPSLAIWRAFSSMLHRSVSRRRRCALCLQKRAIGKLAHYDFNIQLLRILGSLLKGDDTKMLLRAWKRSTERLCGPLDILSTGHRIWV